MGRKLKEHLIAISARLTIPNYYFVRVRAVNDHCSFTRALNNILSEAGEKYALSQSHEDEDEEEA